MDLLSLTAVELGKKIKAGEITTEEAVRATLAAIEAKEPQINSFVTVDRENGRPSSEANKRRDIDRAACRSSGGSER